MMNSLYTALKEQNGDKETNYKMIQATGVVHIHN